MTKIMTQADLEQVKQMLQVHEFKVVHDTDAGTILAYHKGAGEDGKDKEVLKAIQKDKNTWIATLTDSPPKLQWVK